MMYVRLHSRHSSIVYTVGPFTEEEAAAFLAAARAHHEEGPPGISASEQAGATRMFDYWAEPA